MKRTKRRSGLSLLELLAVVTIIGIIAAIVVPRVTSSTDAAKQKVHQQNISEINAAIERYYIDNGSWPSADLSEMVPPTTHNYFPDGLPANPVDSNDAYSMNATTHRVDP